MIAALLFEAKDRSLICALAARHYRLRAGMTAFDRTKAYDYEVFSDV